MKNTFFLTSILLLVIAFASCKKEDPKANEQVSEPELHIHAPTTGSTYHSGDTIKVKVHFMDDDQLHEYHVDITKKSNGESLLDLHGHVHVNSYEVDTFVVINTTTHSDYELTAKVSNHNDAEVTEVVHFHVHS